jgi:hypothetical protein
MKGRCNSVDCGLSQGLTCELGFSDLAQCPNFAEYEGEEHAPEAEVVDSNISGQRLPWSGRAFGINDIILVSGRSSPVFVGLIGLFDAGKTSFLTALFAHFSHSGVVGPSAFAGSYTLQAWFRLKHYTAWPTPSGPSFPPHTPDSAERVPSLLHLGFRGEEKHLRDVLFTDAPGEWFSRWMQNQSSESSKGARWIADNATHFLFFVDRAALAGPRVGKARHEIQVLARILAEHRRGRPIIGVWAKSDGNVAPDVEGPIREKLQKFFGDHPSFDLSVKDPRCLAVLELLLKEPEAVPLDLASRNAEPKSAFFAYQRLS